jgi:hypothetical protein
VVEISPLAALDPEDVAALVLPGQMIESPKYFS